MDNLENLATRRGNQEWTIQRNWQHEGVIKNGQSREPGNTKGKSRMDNLENLATRRGNQEWTIQRNWQHEGEIKNGQSRETGNIGHRKHKTKTRNTTQYVLDTTIPKQTQMRHGPSYKQNRLANTGQDDLYLRQMTSNYTI